MHKDLGIAIELFLSENGDLVSEHLTPCSSVRLFAWRPEFEERMTVVHLQGRDASIYDYSDGGSETARRAFEIAKACSIAWYARIQEESAKRLKAIGLEANGQGNIGVETTVAPRGSEG